MTAAESSKESSINNYLLQKRLAMQTTMQGRTTEKIGPGSYQKDNNLNMMGKTKPSNSVKGFGNGFISKQDRGLEKYPIVKSSPTRSISN